MSDDKVDDLLSGYRFVAPPGLRDRVLGAPDAWDAGANSELVARHFRFRRASVVREMLWRCAGVNVQLARSLGVGQQSLASVGATVLLTATLAFISSSYALHTVFDSVPLAIAFGALWAVMIFNLDQFLVASIRKRDTLRELLMMAPRIAMACLIAFVIVVPLELRLFEKEIDYRLPAFVATQAEQQRPAETSDIELQLRSLNTEIEKIRSEFGTLEVTRRSNLSDGEGARLNRTIEDLNTRISTLEAEQRGALERLAEAQRQLVEEREGLSDSKARGEGAQFRVKDAKEKEWNAKATQIDTELASTRNERDLAMARLDNLLGTSRLVRLQANLQDQERLKAGLQQALKTRLDDIDARQPPTTLLTRIRVVNQLAREDPAVDWTVTLLRLLFVLLETSPIAVKFMLPRGPYDVLRDSLERQEIWNAILSRRRSRADHDRALKSVA